MPNRGRKERQGSVKKGIKGFVGKNGPHFTWEGYLEMNRILHPFDETKLREARPNEKRKPRQAKVRHLFPQKRATTLFRGLLGRSG